MPKKLDRDALNRLFEYTLHEENLFTTHHNFFLVFESVLLGVVAMLLTAKTPSSLHLVQIISILGLISALVWGYIQIRMKWILGHLRKKLRIALPEYKQVIEELDKTWWPLRITWLLTYIIPLIVVTIWFFLLFY
jgi:hypothetical protein